MASSYQVIGIFESLTSCDAKERKLIKLSILEKSLHGTQMELKNRNLSVERRNHTTAGTGEIKLIISHINSFILNYNPESFPVPPN